MCGAGEAGECSSGSADFRLSVGRLHGGAAGFGRGFRGVQA